MAKLSLNYRFLNSGDRLLPIAAEEESPFPTLQEVEEMSNQQIKLAHVNRELPKVDNPTWKSNPDNVTLTTEAETSDGISQSEVETDSITVSEPKSYIGHKIPEDFLVKAGLIGDDVEDDTQVEPIFKLNADGSTRGRFPKMNIIIHFIFFGWHFVHRSIYRHAT